MTPSKRTIAAIRFGYGFHPDQRPPRDAGDLITHVRAPDRFDLTGPSIADRRDAFTTFMKARRAKSGVETQRKAIRALMNRDLVARVTAPIASNTGFYERLATFWSDHFTVAMQGQATRVIAGRYEADAIRPHIGGTLRDMLRAAATHPAMLVFLSQTQSVGPNSVAGKRSKRGLNENLAREILELHTLGVGAPYSQTDIRQFALLLTGLRIDRKTGHAKFIPPSAEPGKKSVLGMKYGGKTHDLRDIETALDDLAAHPATARHIARKLAVHFVSDTPPASLIDAMERAYLRNDSALMPVYEALLDHPESWSRFGEKVKQPFDFVISSLRAAGGRDTAMFKRAGGLQPVRILRLMNQPVLGAPGPDGWPEGERAWINAQGLTVRLDWASKLARSLGRSADPRQFLAQALSDTAREDTIFAVTNAAEKWEGVALTLASPEFNRR